MENTNNATIEKEEAQLIPLLRLCLGQLKAHWVWFLFSVIACAALGFLYLQCQPRIYQRQAVILLEDTDGRSAMGRKASSSMNTLLELNGISVGDNLKNEVFILSSQRIMERVVDSLHLDVDYTIKESLHEVSLYRNRPFRIEFSSECQRPEKFEVVKTGDRKFALSNFERGKDKYKGKVSIAVGETKKTPLGNLHLIADTYIDKMPTGETVTVTRLPKKMAAASYCKQFSAGEYDKKESSLIILGCEDINETRAEDIINVVFDAYKRDIVANKNRVANNTAIFIDERIRIIDGERIASRDQMAKFLSDNKLTDFEQSAQMYLTESSAARKQRLELETQVAVARYLTQYLQNSSKRNETVPVLSLPEASFTPLIGEYNNQMLERNRIAGNTSETSPTIREIDNRLASMRSSLLASIQSYVKSVEMELKEAGQNEAAINSQVGSLPEKQKVGLDIKQQLELKNTLYTYLLNKREEVALQMAISEANVRLVEGPLGSPLPISPRSNIILVISVIIGFFIPSLVLWIRYMLDVTISTRKEIEDATTIPIAGDIPRWDEGNERALKSEAKRS